ncbi:hypothetical protein G6F65_020703 [Rhizopus arrhizus]|nr:hypothetical protein G6F65_020703 [Rhizopus arrhizus]
MAENSNSILSDFLEPHCRYRRYGAGAQHAVQCGGTAVGHRHLHSLVGPVLAADGMAVLEPRFACSGQGPGSRVACVAGRRFRHRAAGQLPRAGGPGSGGVRLPTGSRRGRSLAAPPGSRTVLQPGACSFWLTVSLKAINGLPTGVRARHLVRAQDASPHP